MQLVACDLDGTIVRRDGTVSRRTVEVLTACERKGVKVVFVTGRPPRWVTPIAEATGHRGVAVCGNGAVVLDLATNKVVESRSLGTIDVLDAATRLRTRLPGAAFALETLDGYRREPEYEPRHAAALHAQTGTLAELLIDNPTVIKVLCRQAATLPAPEPARRFDLTVEGERRAPAPAAAEPLSTDAMLALAREVLAGVCEPVHSDPASGMIELAAIGVTKASTLERLAAQHGIGPEQVVAFGDMPNDVAMLSWAGTSYAMTGGHPEAVAAADEVAPPCEDDGVAQVLERLLFG